MRVQRVLMPDGSESWTVLGDDGAPVPAVEGFLARQAASHRKVLVNLDKIIASLQALRPDEDSDHD